MRKQRRENLISKMYGDNIQKLVQLPRMIRLKDRQQLRLEEAKDGYMAEMFNLVKDAVQTGVGVDPSEFPSQEALEDKFKHARETGSAITAIDPETGRIEGLALTGPISFTRGLLAMYVGGYFFVNKRLQNTGLYFQMMVTTTAICAMHGFEGILTRVTSTGTLSTSQFVQSHFDIVANIPNNVHPVGTGPVRDQFVFATWKNPWGIYAKMKEDEVFSRALKTIRPKVVYAFRDYPVNQSLGKLSLKDASQPEEDDIFSLLTEAAKTGDTFSVDEFPTKTLFRESFLSRKKLVAVRERDGGSLIGACIVGPSRLCRGANPQNGTFQMYLLPLHREPISQSAIIIFAEEYLKKCGYSGIVLEEYVCPAMSYKLLREAGYTVVGCFPNCGYLSGQGWADCTLFYKGLHPLPLFNSKY